MKFPLGNYIHALLDIIARNKPLKVPKLALNKLKGI
jgi:hypothetical protein